MLLTQRCMLAAALPVQFVGMCDQNPLTRSLLARSDTVTTIKVTCFKMLLVIASAVLDLPTAQIVIMMFAVLCIFQCYIQAVSCHGCQHQSVSVALRLLTACAPAAARSQPLMSM
jgi:hypothetical protein